MRLKTNKKFFGLPREFFIHTYLKGLKPKFQAFSYYNVNNF